MSDLNLWRNSHELAHEREVEELRREIGQLRYELDVTRGERDIAIADVADLSQKLERARQGQGWGQGR